MDKVAFARLISIITMISNRHLCEDEINSIIYATNSESFRADYQSVDRLLAVMKSGTSKIEAVKEYRTITGRTLKDSKEAVEAHWPVLSEHAS